MRKRIKNIGIYVMISMVLLLTSCTKYQGCVSCEITLYDVNDNIVSGYPKKDASCGENGKYANRAWKSVTSTLKHIDGETYREVMQCEAY